MILQSVMNKSLEAQNDNFRIHQPITCNQRHCHIVVFIKLGRLKLKCEQTDLSQQVFFILRIDE